MFYSDRTEPFNEEARIQIGHLRGSRAINLSDEMENLICYCVRFVIYDDVAYLEIFKYGGMILRIKELKNEKLNLSFVRIISFRVFSVTQLSVFSFPRLMALPGP